jgi:hypothetical protein
VSARVERSPTPGGFPSAVQLAGLTVVVLNAVDLYREEAKA